ncbi:hypothetical protein [Nocardia sp. NPDC004860]|uniref:hypothetical protein n=1 Tax=Nocardia sp. NPDC004860 TaxID=3154557 RepID=UPI0033B17998
MPTNRHTADTEPVQRYAHVDQLHPRVREAMIRLVTDRWDPEVTEYNKLPADSDERDGHLAQHVNVLHNFLSHHSPIRH